MGARGIDELFEPNPAALSLNDIAADNRFKCAVKQKTYFAGPYQVVFQRF